MPRTPNDRRNAEAPVRCNSNTLSPTDGKPCSSGVSVSQLGDGAVRQLTFDDVPAGVGDEPVVGSGRGSGGVAGAGQHARVEAVVDEVRARFGARAVGPASLIGPDGLRVGRGGGQQWGPTTAADPDRLHGPAGPAGPTGST